VLELPRGRRADRDELADDRSFEISAVGEHGRAPLPGFLEDFGAQYKPKHDCTDRSACASTALEDFGAQYRPEHGAP